MPDELRDLPLNKPKSLRNLTCIYCGQNGDPDNPLTKEHVIARKFVPRGALDREWALIACACRRCNNEKADLENDLSAILLQPELGTMHTDPALREQAQRKARGAFSRTTGKAVADSYVEHTIEGKLMPNVSVRFDLVAPPQLDSDRVHRLAYMHLQAFFYLISYDEVQRCGEFIPGPVGFVATAPRSDWGNPLLLGFADLTRKWPTSLLGICAKGNFKIIMRRDTVHDRLWSFALEWNARHRIIGFFGDQDRAQAHVNAMPLPEMKLLNHAHRYRTLQPIEQEDDFLFNVAEDMPFESQ